MIQQDETQAGDRRFLLLYSVSYNIVCMDAIRHDLFCTIVLILGDKVSLCRRPVVRRGISNVNDVSRERIMNIGPRLPWKKLYPEQKHQKGTVIRPIRMRGVSPLWLL